MAVGQGKENYIKGGLRWERSTNILGHKLFLSFNGILNHKMAIFIELFFEERCKYFEAL